MTQHRPAYWKTIYPTLRTRILMPYFLLALTVVVLITYGVSSYIEELLQKHWQQEVQTRGEVVRLLLATEQQRQQLVWYEMAAAASQPSTATTLASAWAQSTGSHLVMVTADNTLWLARTPPTRAEPDAWDWVKQIAVSDGEAPLITGMHTISGESNWFVAGAVGGTAWQQQTGLLLISTSLATLAQQLGAAADADITFYNSRGDVLATTHVVSANTPLTLSPTTVSQIKAATDWQQRPLELASQRYNQVLFPLSESDTGLALVGVSLEQQLFANQVNDTRSLMLATLVLTITVTLIIGYISAIRIGRPIKELMEASQQVAAGNLDVRLGHPARDEIGQLAHSFNNMVLQLRQRRFLEDLFGRYVGDNIAQRILDGEAELGGQRVWATAVFADIRDFTAFTQKVNLNALLDELNEYYATMQRVIDAHGGVVNKFGGDSILALFGVPIPSQNHAQQAINATMAMMEELSGLNNQRLARGVAPIRIGIGVNTGEMIVGNLGSEKRREYTVLGDSVNLAKRFSDLNKETPFDTVFMGEATLSHLEIVTTLQIDDLGLVKVKGKVEPVRVYSVMHRPRWRQSADPASNTPDRIRQSGGVLGNSGLPSS